ncbi:arginyltransferase [Roseimaritima sediminicola]|uniref:arginyltransferase n=1 Tax=Roseimaritima sediminicola TaxID=2662066 RepID=UPI0012983146|nr:arginyltransferase [Roseimaritima sediminicola]
MREVAASPAPRFQDDSLIVIQDSLQPCPYLADQVARMPLQWPQRTYNAADVDAFLAAGYRRSGAFLYRTQCPRCQACEPTRVLVDEYQPSRSQRRVLRRGDRDLEVEVVPAMVDRRHIELFNLHRNQRGLGGELEDIDQMSYRAFLVDTFCQTVEFQIKREGRLVAVAVTDVGHDGVSAVYTYFDPACSRYSLGTYAILKQLQWCRQMAAAYLYLGLYVAENPHLNYKAVYGPQQRLIDGVWQRFDSSGTPPGGGSPQPRQNRV